MVVLNFMIKCDSITNAFVITSWLLLIRISSSEGVGQRCHSHKECVAFQEACDESAKKCVCMMIAPPYYEGVVKKCNGTTGSGGHKVKCGVCPEDQYCNFLGFCRCKDRKAVLVDRSCYNVTWVPPLAKCHITPSRAFLCDEKYYSKCLDGICSCPSEYYRITKYKQCIPIEEYTSVVSTTIATTTRKFGTQWTVGKGLGSLWTRCSDNSDCRVGLICSESRLCSCPGPCTLVDSSTCNCSVLYEGKPTEDKTEGLIPAIIVGVVFSLGTLLFWISRIRVNRRRAQSEDLQTRDQRVPLNPVTSEVTSSNRPLPTAPMLPQRRTHAPTSLSPSAPVDIEIDAPPSYEEAIKLAPPHDSAKKKSEISNDSQEG